MGALRLSAIASRGKARRTPGLDPAPKNEKKRKDKGGGRGSLLNKEQKVTRTFHPKIHLPWVQIKGKKRAAATLQGSILSWGKISRSEL